MTFKGNLRPAIWILAIWLGCAASHAAAAEACAQPVVDRPKIGLVLGGGGARGSAHIGIIRKLEELRVPIDFVAGTSFGSLVGALLATGMNARELETTMLGLDWDDLFVDDTARPDRSFRRKRDDDLALFGPKLGLGAGASLLPAGAIAGQKISFLFETLVHERAQTTDFDQLPIPYRAVAADIATGAEVVLADGSLALAMRSSMSVPGVFDPVEQGGHILVDGGIVNNLPIDVVRQMGADIVIAVDVGSGLTPRDQLGRPLAVILQMTNLMIQKNVDAQVASLTERDLLITPELGDDVSSTDFGKVNTGIAIGYAAAEASAARLRLLSIPEADYARYQQALMACRAPERPVEFVRLDNRSRFDDSVIRERLDIQTGKPLDTVRLDDDLRQIHALGLIELARHELVEEDGRVGVVIHVEPDPRGSRLIEWGLDYSADSDNTTLNFRGGYLDAAVDRLGSEFRALTVLGEDPALLLNLHKYLEPELRYFVDSRLYGERRRLTIYDDAHPAFVTDVSQWGGAIGFGREFGRYGSLSLGLRRFAGSVDPYVGTGPLGRFDYDGGEYVLRGTYDRLDDRYFPGSGTFLDARWLRSDTALGADSKYVQVQIDSLIAQSFERHTIMGGIRYYRTLEHDAPIFALFRAGGFARLSGFNDEELAGRNFAMGLLGYRYQFEGSGLLPANIGMTLEYGRTADAGSDLFDDPWLSGSAYFGYRSPLGPLYLGIGLAEGGRARLFLRIGDVFGRSTIGR
ncbi:MAG: patatin-like phospholipase family protein [Pseudomonadales bacterium]